MESTSIPRADAMKPLEHVATIDYRSELVRKGIHLTSLSIPVIYNFISRTAALELLIPITFAFVIVDLGRMHNPAVARWFSRWFAWLLRKHEQEPDRKRLNGASNVLIAATLCVLLFPKVIAVNAFAILIISDSMSALIGRRYGRRRFMSKSLEGSMAFFVSAVIVVLIAPKVQYLFIEYAIGIAAAAIGAVVEASSVRIDDNLSIPLSVGVVMWGLYLLVAQGVNVYALG